MRLAVTFVSLLKRGPLGSAACSEGLKKGIIFPVHTQDVKIDSLQTSKLTGYIMDARNWI